MHWLKCTSCNQSFHIDCMLKTLLSEKWSEIKQNMETEENKQATELPPDKKGEQKVEEPFRSHHISA